MDIDDNLIEEQERPTMQENNDRQRTVGNKKAIFRLLGLAVLVVILVGAVALVFAQHSKTSQKQIPAAVYAVNPDTVLDMAPYAAGVVLLTSNSLEYVDQYGMLNAKNEHLYTDPVLVSAGKNVVIFDRGGSAMRIEKNAVKYLQLDFDSAVTCADITDKGTYAYVLNADSGYQSHLFAYSSKGRLLFEWSSSDYVLDVSLSPNGKYAAAATISVENAETVCKVVLFHFAKSEPVVLEFTGETVYDVEFVTGKKVAVQTNTATHVVNFNGEIETLCTFSVNELNHTDVFKGGMGLTSLNLYGNNNNALVHVFDRGFKKSYDLNFPSAVLSVTASAGYAAVLYSDQIEILDNSSEAVGAVTLPETSMRCAISGQRIYVLSSGGLRSFSLHETYGGEE